MSLEEDLLYSNLPVFKRRIKQAGDFVARCLSVSKKNIGISVSGGKDSVMLAHMVLKQRPDANLYFFDSGAEYDETYEVLEQMEKLFNKEIQQIFPEVSILELTEKACREGLYVGEIKEYLVERPSYFASIEDDIDMFFIGLRKEESKFRSFGLNSMEEPYCYSKEYKYWKAYPLMNLKWQDVFAYLVKHNLPIHKHYTDENIFTPKHLRRVGNWAGTVSATNGRFYILKLKYPELYEKLEKVRNDLAKYT
jgi:phosphoadenosine phosphosulfate reductase